MKYKIVSEEGKHCTYLNRIILLACDVIWIKVIYKAFFDNSKIGLTILSLAIFALLLYGTYYAFRTMYFCIPMSRYYNAKELKKSIEEEKFTILKDKMIWESEHWLRIKNVFFPKSLICGLGGSVAANTIMTVRTLDRKEYTIQHVGHLERRKEEELIANTLPLVKFLNEKGYDGLTEMKCSPCLSDKLLDEMFKNYLSNHSVEDLVTTTDIMEMYVKEYDRIMSGGRKKKEITK